MDKLTKYLVDGILKENDIKNIVVVYSGRFQPFHKGHYDTYSHLVKKFGKDNVFIGTSDKVKKPRSPFNFEEKVKIMTTMFGIPTSKIHKIKNPYKPTEILSKFDENTTAFITVVGEKDKDRLGSKYFTPYKGEPTDGYKDRGYVYVAPLCDDGVCGTEVRNGLSVGSDEEKKNFFKNRAYSKFNPEIFKLITNKLSEGVLEIKKEWIEDWLLNESTLTGVGQDDDGPGSFLPPTAFPKVSMERAAKIGYQVIDSALKPEIEGFYDYPTYPDGPVAAVSFFPAGVIGKTTATNQIDLYNKDAYIAWFQHATRWATLTGYKLVRNVITKDVEDEIADFAVLMARDLEDYFEDEYHIDVQSGGIFNPEKLGLSDTIIPDELRLRKIREDINVSRGVNFRMTNEGQLNESIIADILIKLIAQAGALVVGTFVKVFLQMAVNQSFDGLMRYYNDIKNIVAPRPYIKFLKSLNKNDAFNKQFIQFTIQNRKGDNLVGNSWIKKITALPAFVDAFDKFTKEEGIVGMDKSNLLHTISKSMWDVYLRNWKGLYKMLKKKYPQLTNELPEGKLDEIRMVDLVKIDKYADKQLDPFNVVLTDKHFFDRLNDPRNKKDISSAELIGFFKRLAKKKKDFLKFLNQYQQIVAKDNRTNINIPFMKQANKAIAKTIMRKRDFKTYDPMLNFEGLSGNMSLEDIAKKHKVKVSDLSTELDMGVAVEKEHTSDKSMAKRIALDHLFEDPKYYTKLKKIENPVTEAQAVSGGKIHKFITGKNLTLKGKKYPDIEFEVLGVDNRSQVVKLRVLAPKSLFGQELNVPFKTIRRGPFIKTDTSKLENLGHGYPDQEWMDNHEKKMKKLRKQLDKQ